MNDIANPEIYADVSATGVKGLDDILCGLTPLRLYLVEGVPGSGKTTLAMQYLLEGARMVTPVDASYLADAVILMRYFETRGEVRQAISVMKKRGGRHERTIRDFALGPGGIKVESRCAIFAACSRAFPFPRAPSAR
jgi:KaiC/GvpD/RAD55 family RecA-like ATPase